MFAFLIAGLYLFPNLLPGVVFATYIGTGHTLDLATAVTCLVLFNLMKEPLIGLPMFVTDMIEMVVSMKRMQKFIETDEVQSMIVVRRDEEEGPALEIRGNFSWGLSEKKEEEEEEKVEVDEKKRTLG